MRTTAPAGVELAVDEEIRNHIELLTDRLTEGGMERDAAEREARRRFGVVAEVRAQMVSETRVRERRTRWRERLGSLGHDVRYAGRGLVRQPVFALAVIGTVALGLGAAASVFSVIDALLLRPLPYQDSERLVEINAVRGHDFVLTFVPAAHVASWKESGEGFDSFAVFENRSFIRTDGPNPRETLALLVSHDLDDLLGVKPALGRTFAADDAEPGVRRVMLSHPYWRASGLGAAAIGSTIELDREVYDVVGVLPAEFKFPVYGRSAIWVALGNDLSVAGARIERASVLARLAPSVSLEAAQERADMVARQITGGDTAALGSRVKLNPIGNWRGNRDLVSGMKLIAGAVLMMLLIALVNGVNLLLFRASDRVGEMAVRRALGGGRLRILRQVMVEGMMIGILAALAAAVLAVGGVAILRGLAPEELMRATVFSFRVEERTILFTMALAAAAGLVLGMIPGIGAVTSRDGTIGGMRSSRGSSRATTRLQWSLVIAEVALAVALVSGAGLLGNSLIQLSTLDTGFAQDEVVALQMYLPEARYPTATSRVDFMDRLEGELEAQPQIQGMTVASGVPSIAGFSFGVELQAEGGQPITKADDFMLLPIVSARPDYMRTVGGRLVAGRDLGESDRDQNNVLIDERLAGDLFAADAIGKRFRTSEEDSWLTVVGVYAHTLYLGLDDRTSPYSIVKPWSDARAETYIVAAIRSADPVAAMASIRSAVTRIDPELPVSQMHTAAAGLAETIERPRFLATVMIALASVALTLAAMGIYGVLAHVMSRRRRELGIRLALGAQPRRLRSSVLKDGLLVAGVGTIAGIFGAVWIGRAVGALLYGVQPTDPITLTATVLVVLATATLASWVPALSATRVDPVEVLRAE